MSKPYTPDRIPQILDELGIGADDPYRKLYEGYGKLQAESIGQNNDWGKAALSGLMAGAAGGLWHMAAPPGQGAAMAQAGLRGPVGAMHEQHYKDVARREGAPLDFAKTIMPAAMDQIGKRQSRVKELEDKVALMQALGEPVPPELAAMLASARANVVGSGGAANKVAGGQITQGGLPPLPMPRGSQAQTTAPTLPGNPGGPPRVNPGAPGATPQTAAPAGPVPAAPPGPAAQAGPIPAVPPGPATPAGPMPAAPPVPGQATQRRTPEPSGGVAPLSTPPGSVVTETLPRGGVSIDGKGNARVPGQPGPMPITGPITPIPEYPASPNASEDERVRKFGSTDMTGVEERKALSAAIMSGDVKGINDTILKLREQRLKSNELTTQRDAQDPKKKFESEVASARGKSFAEREDAIKSSALTLAGAFKTIGNLMDFSNSPTWTDSAVGPWDNWQPFGVGVGPTISSVLTAGNTVGSTEARRKIDGDMQALLAITKGMVRKPGEGTWSDGDQKQLERTVGDLLNADNKAGFQRDLANVWSRLTRAFAEPYGIDVPQLINPATGKPQPGTTEALSKPDRKRAPRNDADLIGSMPPSAREDFQRQPPELQKQILDRLRVSAVQSAATVNSSVAAGNSPGEAEALATMQQRDLQRSANAGRQRAFGEPVDGY